MAGIIDEISVMLRVLWELEAKGDKSSRARISLSRLAAECGGNRKVVESWFEHVSLKGKLRKYFRKEKWVSVSVEEEFDVYDVVYAIRRDVELWKMRDILARAIVRGFCANYDVETIRVFRGLSDSINQHGRTSISSDQFKRIASEFESEEITRFFFEICKSCRSLRKQIHPRRTRHLRAPGAVYTRGKLDSDFLLAHAFGVKTRIGGFRELFGGGVIVGRFDRVNVGKVMVIRGARGVGKTLLASQILGSVAELGGVAFHFALDQSIDEIRRQLALFGLAKNVRIVEGARAFLSKCKEPEIGGGLYGISSISKISLENHVEALSDFLDALEPGRFPLCAVCVDPVNSVVVSDDSDQQSVRNLRNQVFERMREMGVLGIVTAEPESIMNPHFDPDDNIADIVLSMWAAEGERYSYTERFVEVVKSRGQGTNRGRQAFTIREDGGCRVFAAPAAFMSRHRGRRRYSGRNLIVPTGCIDLDRALGNPGPEYSNDAITQGLSPGSIMVFRGGGHGRKRLLAEAFGAVRRAGSVVHVCFGEQSDFGDRDEAVLEMNSEAYRCIDEHLVGYKSSNYNRRVLNIENSFVRAGELLQMLESELMEDRRSGSGRIEKVVFENVENIELFCPLVSGDNVFWLALLQFLRRLPVSCLFVINEDRVRKGGVFDSLLSNSDVVVNFASIFFRGRTEVAVHVDSARGRDFLGAVFSLDANVDGGLTLSHRFELLRDAMGGRSDTIPIRLLLHSETNLHHRYELAMRDTLKNTLNSDVEISDIGGFDIRVAKLGRYSSEADLRIVQLDEFQLEGAKETLLKGFDATGFDGLMGGSEFPNYVYDSIVRKDDIYAVPYYGNLSVLVHDQSVHLSSDYGWGEIAEFCEGNSDEVVFDFPLDRDEHINCLFWEILLSSWSGWEDVEKLEIFFVDTQRVEVALTMLWRVGHRAFQRGSADGQDWSIVGEASVKRDEVRGRIWRHWFTTLQEMYSCMDSFRANSLVVRELPGAVSVAGDWFLGVTKYSQGSRAGQSILENVGSFSSAFDRHLSGVGFPLHSKFLDSGFLGLQVYSHPVGKVDLGLLHRRAFRRSRYREYGMGAFFLSQQLRLLLRFRSQSDMRKNVSSLATALKNGFEERF